MSDLSLKSVADLKKLAKSSGVKGYTKMKKHELVDILSRTAIPVVFEQPVIEKGITDFSVKELKELAKNKGIPKYYQLTKPQLVAALGIVPQQPKSIANVQEKYTYEQLVSKSVKQLKDIAKESGVKSYYKMNKDDLVKSIMEQSASLFEEPIQPVVSQSVSRPVVQEQVVEVPISPENIYQPEPGADLGVSEPVMIIGQPLVPEITESSERGYKYIDDILKEIQFSDTDKYMKEVNTKIMKCLGIY